MTERPSIRKWPEGDRPREKLIQLGAESLTDAELRVLLPDLKEPIEQRGVTG